MSTLRAKLYTVYIKNNIQYEHKSVVGHAALGLGEAELEELRSCLGCPGFDGNAMLTPPRSVRCDAASTLWSDGGHFKNEGEFR